MTAQGKSEYAVDNREVTADNPPMIRIEGLSGGYDGQLVVKDVSFDVHQGEFVSLLGPNGSGKSTILKLITGLLPLSTGNVLLNGQQLQTYSTLDKARLISVLSQEEHVSFDFTAEEIVRLGRYPFQQGWFRTFANEDRIRVEEAMELTQVSQFREIPFRLLSGGEKQRVLLAKAFVQEPSILLLDEPTNHLDIHHSYELLQLLKEWQQSRKLTVLAILHDLNLAALYSDRIALLQEGTIKEIGEPNIFNKDQLGAVYQVDVHTLAHPDTAKPQIHLAVSNEQHSSIPLERMYRITQSEQVLHVQFQQPLRTISNGVLGEGLQWSEDFCNFYVTKDYNCSDPQKDMTVWMEKLNISPVKAVGMMTAVQLQNAVHLVKSFEGVTFIALVTAGVGNPVDIVGQTEPLTVRQAGTINTFVFVDAHLSDGALINACMSATEAKTKALASLHILDSKTQTLATGTATDSLCIGSTQRGERTAYAGSGTVIGIGIAQVVYEATCTAIKKYLQTN